MIPGTGTPFPVGYRASDALSEGSSEHTVRGQARQTADSQPDPDIVMRDGAPTSEGHSNTAQRSWFDGLDARTDNPTAYHIAPQSALTNPSEMPPGPGLVPHLVPLSSVQLSNTVTSRAQDKGRVNLNNTSYSTIERGSSERAGPSGFYGIDILNPSQANRASSDPGQRSRDPRGEPIRMSPARNANRQHHHTNGSHANSTSHFNGDEGRSEPDSSDEEPPFAQGPVFQIPPVEMFRHGSSRDNESGVPYVPAAGRNAANNSQAHHQPVGQHENIIPRLQSQQTTTPQPLNGFMPRPADNQQPLNQIPQGANEPGPGARAYRQEDPHMGRPWQPAPQATGVFGLGAPPQGQSSNAQQYRPTHEYVAQNFLRDQNPQNPQSQTYVTMGQFSALQQRIDQGFQSMENLMMMQPPLTLPDRRRRSRPSQSITPMPPKLYDLPVHRDPPVNDFHKSVREHLEKLLGPDPLEVRVTAQESTNYATRWLKDKGRTCPPSTTAEAFRIDIAGLPRGPWNRSAADVFVADYARAQSENIPYDSQRWKTLRDQALDRCESLKAAYRRKQLNAHDLAMVGKRRRASGRQMQRYGRRLKGARRFNVAPEHITILRQLGPEGMSSDESDWFEPNEGPSSERCPQYFIHRPKWRNHGVVTAWLRILDSLYQMYRNSKTDRRGARVRRRGEKSNTQPVYSTRDKFIAELPINAYDERWLRGPDATIELVKPQAAFSFQHHPDILEAVRKSRVRTEYN